MSEEDAVIAWCRLVRLVIGMDEEQIAVLSAMADVVKASRGRVAPQHGSLSPVRKLGTGPLLNGGN